MTWGGGLVAVALCILMLLVFDKTRFQNFLPIIILFVAVTWWLLMTVYFDNRLIELRNKGLLRDLLATGYTPAELYFSYRAGTHFYPEFIAIVFIHLFIFSTAPNSSSWSDHLLLSLLISFQLSPPWLFYTFRYHRIKSAQLTPFETLMLMTNSPYYRGIFQVAMASILAIAFYSHIFISGLGDIWLFLFFLLIGCVVGAVLIVYSTTPTHEVVLNRFFRIDD